MFILKIIPLTLLATVLSSYKAPNCKCRSMSFDEEVAYADNIFTGTVVNKTSAGLMHYTFAVSKTFKGAKADTLTLKTGHGGGDCGMRFEVGKTYLVYSREGHTSYCRRNALAEKTNDVEKLAVMFPSGKPAPVKD